MVEEPSSNASFDAVRKNMRCLRRNEDLRIVLDAILTDQPLPENAANTLLENVRLPKPWDWKRSFVAAWALGQISLDETAKLQATASLSYLLANRPARSLGCLIAGGCLFSYLGFLYFVYASAMDTPINRVRQAAAVSLGQIGGIGAIEPLQAAMQEMPHNAASADKSVRIASTWSLLKMLRSIPESSRPDMPAVVVNTACRQLNDRTDSVVLTALEFLKTSGTGTAIPFVQKVEKSGRTGVLREQATRTLEILNARLQKEKARQTLLRPASLPSDAETHLLRPAGTSDTPDETLLLRPSAEAAEEAG